MTNVRRRPWLAAAGAAALSVALPVRAQAPLPVVASFSILADLVRKGIAACEFRAIDAQAVSQVALDNLLMLALRRVTFSDGSNAPHFAQAIDTTLDVCLCGLIRPPAP
jgi:hypothetical protein